MKRILIVFIAFAIFSCKEATKEPIDHFEERKEEVDVNSIGAPVASIFKVFEAHGGLETWKNKRTLSFTVTKPDNPERHTIDLYSRREKIETPEMAMGFDGKDFWLADEKESYKGDPIFYHNLMFYFYSMPFVLADDGIEFSETEDLEFDGKSYPGVRITYKDGVGISSKDEYFLHYNAETNQMAWLGYTVTYRSGEKSDNVKWIRYNDWMETEGLKLPNSMTWHEYEGRTIKGPRDSTTFENVLVSESAKPDAFYAKPENAKVVTKAE